MSKSFLIVERDLIVGQDLSELLTEIETQPEIFICGTVEEAEAHAARLTSLRAAFLSLAPDEISSSSLPQRIAEIGGRIVVLDDRQVSKEKAATNWVFVPRPFTTGMIRTAMAQI